MTKIAVKLLYGESRCPNLETNTPTLGALAESRNILKEDWQKGGHLRSLLESNIQLVKAEFGSTTTRPSVTRSKPRTVPKA